MKLKDLLKEQIDLNDLYQETVNYLESKININKYKKRIYASGDDTTFLRSEKDRNDKLTILKWQPANEILLKFDVKIIVDSTSLADPKARYLTTTARRVNKTKRVRIDKGFDDINKIKKEIDKFLEKTK